MIQTLTKYNKWIECEHKSWKELKEDGWEFEYATSDGGVHMARNGYINVFKQV